MKKLYSKVTPFIQDLLNSKNISEVIKKQYCIDEKEYLIRPVEELDPIGEDVYTKCKGVIHRYNDRALNRLPCSM